MNKSKALLAAICFLAAAGGALASKARFANFYVQTAQGQYSLIDNAKVCAGSATDCTTFTLGKVYTLFTRQASPVSYITQKQPLVP